MHSLHTHCLTSNSPITRQNIEQRRSGSKSTFRVNEKYGTTSSIYSEWIEIWMNIYKFTKPITILFCYGFNEGWKRFFSFRKKGAKRATLMFSIATPMLLRIIGNRKYLLTRHLWSRFLLHPRSKWPAIKWHKSWLVI